MAKQKKTRKRGGSDALYEDFRPKSRKRKKKKINGFLIIILALVLVLAGGIGYLFWSDNAYQAANMGNTVDDNIVVQDDEITITKDEVQEIDNSDLSIYPGLGEGVKNILLLGTDSRLSSGNGLTDSIIILSINQDTFTVKLASIMRDTWVSIPGRSKNAKINAANVYGGPNLAIKTVNESFGMNIDDYVLLNMQGLVGVLEVLGGIELDISQGEMKHININLDGYKGDLISAGVKYNANDFAKLNTYGANTHLSPQQALAYSRIRALDSDYARTDRQRNVLVAMAEKATKQNVLQLTNMATKVLPYISTSLSIDEIVSLASIAWRTDLNGIEQTRLPADGTYESGNKNGVWSIRPNFEKNRQLLHDFLYGTE